ncbi:MAG: PAS domain-containing protein [Acidobacteriaceae bacterium]|jgi:signal transduction histidine kinase|nr:PAS domain-containing protein [Acidobacteriaceae bacterium]
MNDDLISTYSTTHRTALLVGAALLIVGIATLDFVTKPYFSLGFLYLFPIMIVGGLLRRPQIVLVSLVCAVLQEAFSNLPGNEAIVRLVMGAAGFTGTGLFVSELIRNRQMALTHVVELEEQERLRRAAEQELQFLVDTSPAAILTIDRHGQVMLANEATHRLLDVESPSLLGRSVGAFLPSLQTIVQTHSSKMFRTMLQCRGQRENGEGFLVGVWFSTYTTANGPRLAAIVVDLSDDLRTREDLSLDHLLKNARILMSAVAHEIRNLCSAALVVHKNLSQLKELQQNDDFIALSTLIQSLETVLSLELQPSEPRATAVELMSVFDEVRVLIDAAFGESQMTVVWQIPDSLPLVRAERYGLIQVFLNLAKNSQRAMQSTPVKQLRVSAVVHGQTVTIRFEDTGTGVEAPEHLFHPFQPGARSTGLGLYVSLAIMRNAGGDLVYEPRPTGACFAIVLGVASETGDHG